MEDDEFIVYEDSDSDDEDVKLLQSEVNNLTADRAAISHDENILLNLVSNSKDADTDVEVALALNKAVDRHFKTLECQLKERLTDITEKLKKIERSLEKTFAMRVTVERSIVRCGMPYFKDQEKFPAPLNLDAAKMNEASMLKYLNTRIAIWTEQDYKKVQTGMVELSRNSRKKAIERNIRDLERKPKHSKMKVKQLQKELIDVEQLPLTAVALPIDADYDWEVIVKSLNYRHSDSEVASLWRLCLHPLLNKEPFTQSEKKKLESLALTYKEQNWDRIASELNTNRNSYQCFTYYVQEIWQYKKGVRWSREEDEALIYIIDSCRIGNFVPWAKVAFFCGNRSRRQVYNRWFYSLQPEIHKGPFTNAEDRVIVAALEKYGSTETAKLGSLLKHRTCTQIKKHVRRLRKVHTKWTTEDDALLLKHVKKDDNIANRSFKSLMQYLPRKNIHQIRLRLDRLQRWFTANPNKSITDAPRRSIAKQSPYSKIKNSFDGKIDIDAAMKELNDELSTKKINDTAAEVSVDDESDQIDFDLMTYFIFENAERKQKISNVFALNLFHILTLLKADLSPKAMKRIDSDKYWEPHLVTGLNAARPIAATVPIIRTYGKKKEETPVSMSFPSIAFLPPSLDTLLGYERLTTYLRAAEPYYNKIKEDQRKMTVTLRNDASQLWEERLESVLFWPILMSTINKPKK